ncbi:MAG: MerR family transcriptional regulator [Lachnospiraceae bacterium]|nr:MerR family transcriptional regulator [Lachnospiraceae bacterium]
MSLDEENVSEYTIPSAQFARICGTTRDTLRYYEQQKILIPWKNPANGYHYYSYAQIGSFYIISTLRSVGFQTRTIEAFLLSDDDKAILNYLSVQLDALKKERNELGNKIRQFSGALRIASMVQPSEFGVPVVRECPPDIRFRVAPVTSKEAYSLRDIAQDIQNHINLFPDMSRAFPAGTIMDAQGFLKGDYRYTKVVSLFHSDDFDLNKEDPRPGTIEAWDSVETVSLPTRKVAAIACRDSDVDIREIYERLASYIRENNLPILTDVLSLSLVNIMDPHQNRRYLKYIFVCTEESVPMTPFPEK